MTVERHARLIVVWLLLLSICTPQMASASTATVVKLWIGNPTMTINGTSTAIDAQGTKPVITEGRTLVPIRAVIEAFGGSVSWEPTTRKVTVTLAKNTLDLWIGKAQASLNGQARPIDSANPRVLPVITGGRTMLPLRFVTESLGIEVQYEAATKMITLTYSVAAELPPVQSNPLALQAGWSFVPDNFGGYVVGRVVNTSSKTVGTATIVFALLDKNGKTVAKGIDLTTNLNPGATWLFEVSNTNSDVVSAEFISVDGH
ncbi:MAG: stalk domain-containing protein [Candidatus Cryosericum sp.]